MLPSTLQILLHLLMEQRQYRMLQTFLDLATVNNVGWAPFLDGQLYVKFGILDRDTPEPKIYFINSNTYTIHATFFNSIGASVVGDDSSGEIVFNPNQIIFKLELLEPIHSISPLEIPMILKLLKELMSYWSASMPFLQNNMNHFIGQADENNYLNNYADRFCRVLESMWF